MRITIAIPLDYEILKEKEFCLTCFYISDPRTKHRVCASYPWLTLNSKSTLLSLALWHWNWTPLNISSLATGFVSRGHWRDTAFLAHLHPLASVFSTSRLVLCGSHTLSKEIWSCLKGEGASVSSRSLTVHSLAAQG